MKKIYIFLLILFLIFLFTSCFIIKEGYQGLLFRCGHIVKENSHMASIYVPGIYFRVPCIEYIKIFDKRIQTTQYLKYDYFTKKQNFFIIEYYVKWKISNCYHYYLTINSNNINLLKNFLHNQLNISCNINAMGFKTNTKIINSKNVFCKNFDIIKKFEKIGIDIVDIGVKKIQLSHDCTKYIYNNLNKIQRKIAMNQFLQGKNTFKKDIFTANDNIIKFLLKKHQQLFIDQNKLYMKKYFCMLKNYTNIFKLNII